MSIFLSLVSVALAAPAGFEQTKTTERCALFLGPALANGVRPMRAECHFPEVDLAKLDAAFSRWQDHDLPFATVLSSDVVRTEGGTAWVRQVHAVKGVSDREGVLRMKKTPIAGGSRFEWTLDDGGAAPGDGRVPIGFDDGFWELTAHPEGGGEGRAPAGVRPGRERARVPGPVVSDLRARDHRGRDGGLGASAVDP
jgi:hypothetical protein